MDFLNRDMIKEAGKHGYSITLLSGLQTKMDLKAHKDR
jgi:hypothetical protein